MPRGDGHPAPLVEAESRPVALRDDPPRAPVGIANDEPPALLERDADPLHRVVRAVHGREAATIEPLLDAVLPEALADDVPLCRLGQ